MVGSANVDFIMRLPKLPALGETVTDGTFLQTFGGKGANSAVAAARAAESTGLVAFVGRLGQDAFCHTMLNNFRQDGLMVEHLGIDANLPSGTALVMIGPDGDNYLSVAPGSNHALNNEHLDAAVHDGADLITSCKVLLTQMEVPADVVRHALDKASRAGVHTILNYAPAGTTPIEVNQSIRTLIVNETEAAQLANRDDKPENLAAALMQLGPETVMVTLGAEGVVVCNREGIKQYPAFDVIPIDATAAGDTFCGAFAVATAEGRPIDVAVRFAQAAAAICVEGFGAQPSIPKRDQIQAKLVS